MKLQKILFVCKYNRFRSVVAEALFRKYNKNKKIRIKSAATNPDYIPTAKIVVKILREKNAKRIKRKPEKLKTKDISRADLIVIVADNVHLRKYRIKNKKVITWKISDTSQENISEIKKRVIEIEKALLKFRVFF